MAGIATVTAAEVSTGVNTNGQAQPKRLQKRKRTSALWKMNSATKETQIQEYRKELEGLFRYYREMMVEKKLEFELGDGNGSLNAIVAMLIEESSHSYSRLVDEIYGKVKERSGDSNLTITAVNSAVLFVGQRLKYGVDKPDANILEDETEDCLWCWETRDVKFMPLSVRASLRVRRTCRRKIHERITAVTAMITALQSSDSDQNYEERLMNASEKLSKVFSEARIRSLVDGMLQKSFAEDAEKKVKQEEKLRIKQLETDMREAEKERKRIDREHQRDALQSEKELRRHQEAEKDEKVREKEESEMKKQLKRKQEDDEKSQRRRLKEEAEQKKQLAIKKQVSVMERFLKRSKPLSPIRHESSTPIANSPASVTGDSKRCSPTVTVAMDIALSSNAQISADDIRKSHKSSWRLLGHLIRSNKKQYWGLRQKPKTELYKELKISTSTGLSCEDESSTEKLENAWEEQTPPSDQSCVADIPCSSKKCSRRKQLLQFDKSCRPAFYGKWPNKSNVIQARHPLNMDPDIDYDVDSDEEWEEEEPGESLSDCDKDDEDNLESLQKSDEEEESEDGFFVPDGYLSENEGVQVDKMEMGRISEESSSSPSYKQNSTTQDFSTTLLQQQKLLNNLTEHALRKNQPRFILNLMHEKSRLLTADDLCGNSKLEQTCLLALSVRPFHSCPPIEISLENMEAKDVDLCASKGKDNVVPVSIVDAVPDSEMPLLVSVIQSCSQGIDKILESLQQKLPSVSKTQLRNKVRAISEFSFTENQWQVKKEIMNKFGKSVSPEKSEGRNKSITTFFSKRCLPPSDKNFKANKNSSQPSQEGDSPATPVFVD